ncbi:hypothetical protein [uncultured Brevundimonas sp.]|nr:hypothetical protein [uncultured Brevundimonas sp.]
MFDAAAFDLRSREDFFLAGFEQLVLGAAQAALHEARRRPMRAHVT